MYRHRLHVRFNFKSRFCIDQNFKNVGNNIELLQEKVVERFESIIKLETTCKKFVFLGICSNLLCLFVYVW